MIEFEPLAESDLPLVADWLGHEHIARWWRNPEASLLPHRLMRLDRP